MHKPFCIVSLMFINNMLLFEISSTISFSVNWISKRVDRFWQIRLVQSLQLITTFLFYFWVDSFFIFLFYCFSSIVQSLQWIKLSFLSSKNRTLQNFGKTIFFFHEHLVFYLRLHLIIIWFDLVERQKNTIVKVVLIKYQTHTLFE